MFPFWVLSSLPCVNRIHKATWASSDMWVQKVVDVRVVNLVTSWKCQISEMWKTQYIKMVLNQKLTFEIRWTYYTCLSQWIPGLNIHMIKQMKEWSFLLICIWSAKIQDMNFSNIYYSNSHVNTVCVKLEGETGT